MSKTTMTQRGMGSAEYEAEEASVQSPHGALLDEVARAGDLETQLAMLAPEELAEEASESFLGNVFGFSGKNAHLGKAWKSLSVSHKAAWTNLGWTESTWNANKPPASDSKTWKQLTKSEQASVKTLGYTEKTWNDKLPVNRNQELNKLVKDQVFEKGAVAHLSATEVDKQVRQHLGDYVKRAMRTGASIAGNVAVVGDADWDKAGEYHYGYSRWHSPRAGQTRLYRDSINGFVDKEGRVWVHRNRGNLGTMVHEAVHKYSHSAMVRVSQPLNEGVTEYFSRKVCVASGIDIADRRNYQANWRVVGALSRKVTEAALAKAYFDGDVNYLRNAFTMLTSPDKKLSYKDMLNLPGAHQKWKAFVEASKSDDWEKAQEILSS